MPLALACAPLTAGAAGPPEVLGPGARPLGEGWTAAVADAAAAVDAVVALVRAGGWRRGGGGGPPRAPPAPGGAPGRGARAA
ncbi:hypothetical protein, partial [Geodermatophilus sp. SYSU D00710]